MSPSFSVHPLETGVAPTWASAWGEDVHGPWAAIELGAVEVRLRWIPGGTFWMGSPEGEAGRWGEDHETDNWSSYDEGPRHQVRLSEGFWICQTPCTQEAWEEVMGSNPSEFVSPTRPVEKVSWQDCQDFLTRLNQRIEGLDARLPTEAQWERACRGGTEDATFAGDLEILGRCNAPLLDDIAWYSGNSGVAFELDNGLDTTTIEQWIEKQHEFTRAGTHPVGCKQANPYGLHDVLGNVLEWCADPAREYDSELAVDPEGSPGGAGWRGSLRALRGGSWGVRARLCRAAARCANAPEGRIVVIGFRWSRGQ
ncbi:MAG: formylglycine-generating enzyme family protein [Acidobacteriota bacterium]